MLVLNIEKKFPTAPKNDEEVRILVIAEFDTKPYVADVYWGSFGEIIRQITTDYPAVEHFVTETGEEPIHCGGLTLREAIVAAYRVG